MAIRIFSRTGRRHAAWLSALAVVLLPSTALAQRQLYWDRLDVEAHLQSTGILRVTEMHTMVFTGEWNGGERQFNIRPRQKLAFIGIDRIDAGGVTHVLTEDRSLDDVDDYAWVSPTVLRWRSRRPSDPSFSATAIRYAIRYELSGILQRDDERYRLDHDFAFPDRDGFINRFTLQLTLDEAWQSDVPVRPAYTAGPIPPGESFVLTMPLRLTGAGTPVVLDTSRPRALIGAVAVVLAATVALVAAFFRRETALGRFAPVSASAVDADWVAEHVLVHPAEVVGAAWDDAIGSPEVVALIARMVAEGKLESDVTGKAMSLRLKVDRSSLEGRESALVNGLFFNGRTETSTTAVRAHYKERGFNPVDTINDDLRRAVIEVTPFGPAPKARRRLSSVLFLIGLGLVGYQISQDENTVPVALMLLIPSLVLAGMVQIPGSAFRTYVNWGPRAAAFCLVPAALIVGVVVAYLWWWVGTGDIEMPVAMVWAIVAFCLGIVSSAIDGLRSRQSAEHIAFRKRLTAARTFFAEQLNKPQPALRDQWWPWVVAFGLGKQADDWSTRYQAATQRVSESSRSESSGSRSGESATAGAWTGAGGGRSGGAGGGATWAAAASGMAAAVSPPSSTGSSGGSSSSSGGSSGGGGGGGW